MQNRLAALSPHTVEQQPEERAIRVYTPQSLGDNDVEWTVYDRFVITYVTDVYHQIHEFSARAPSKRAAIGRFLTAMRQTYRCRESIVLGCYSPDEWALYQCIKREQRANLQQLEEQHAYP
jgi:hypothetical protein